MGVLVGMERLNSRFRRLRRASDCAWGLEKDSWDIWEEGQYISGPLLVH